MIYLNNNNEQYILSFLGSDSNILATLFDFNTKIEVDDNITIISLLPNNSIFNKQLDSNNISYYKASESTLLSVINKVNSEYLLIIRDWDALIVKDLNLKFLHTFNYLNKDVLFAAMPTPYPFSQDLTNIKFSLINSINRYINSSICFGYTEQIKAIYKQLDTINLNLDPTNANLVKNKFLITCAFTDLLSVKQNSDYNNELFSTIQFRVNKIKEVNNIRYIERDIRYNLANLLL